MSLNNQKLSVKKPYCKVCHDAGKQESEYTSHYVRTLPDRNGNTVVTCPTLLSIECRFCFQKGHTIKFCQILLSKKKNEDRSIRKKEYTTFVDKRNLNNSKKQPNPRNSFNLLNNIEEEREEEKQSLRDVDFPELGVSKVTKEFKPLTGWVDIAKKAPAEYDYIKPTFIQKQPTFKSVETKKNYTIKNWYDYTSDSEDDSDEEEYNEEDQIGQDEYGYYEPYAMQT